MIRSPSPLLLLLPLVCSSLVCTKAFVHINSATSTKAVAFVVEHASAGRRWRQGSGRHGVVTTIKAATTSEDVTDNSSILGGVQEFEEWFEKNPKAFVHSSVSHGVFDKTLRGLAWKGGATPSFSDNNKNNKLEIACIPLSMILQTKKDSSSSSSSWDSDLACQLIQECRKGSKSAVSGYCQLLMNGDKNYDWSASSTVAPGSTAPHALRHWTASQRDLLIQTCGERGQRLVDLCDEQMKTWRDKYDSLSNQNDMSFEQFVWAMEVVHSRAFRGNILTVTSGDNLLGLVAPIVAAGMGIAYNAATNMMPEIPVLVVLGAIAALPTLLKLISGDNDPSSSSSVCLLPLIDSANHLEEADSNILLDPIQSTVSLQIGPKCFVPQGGEERDQTQVYISYGKKSNAELLLNYGFLPGVVVPPSSCSTDDDEQRRRLAQAFSESS